MKQKKHAYLIMAHNNFYCLEKLLLLLDDSRNDIYLHIDKKVKNFNFDYFQELCVNANVIYPKKRINVTWGTQSQVKTELLLFETSSKNGPYHYYHLLSGSDLPLKTQQEIHNFFSSRNEAFLYYNEKPGSGDIQRISRYHLFPCTSSPFLLRIETYFSAFQQKLKIDRSTKLNIMIKKGSNWGSIPQSAVDILLENKKSIMQFTRFSVCADEVYKQSLLYSKQYPMIRNCLRYTTWKVGLHPHIYTAANYQSLICSSNLFARKFDENVDKKIIDMIFEHIKQQESSGDVR